MNQKELRKAFIEEYEASGALPRLKKTPRGRVLEQNEQPADVRVSWVDFVDAMRKDDQITDKVARNATL